MIIFLYFYIFLLHLLRDENKKGWRKKGESFRDLISRFLENIKDFFVRLTSQQDFLEMLFGSKIRSMLYFFLFSMKINNELRKTSSEGEIFIIQSEHQLILSLNLI